MVDNPGPTISKRSPGGLVPPPLKKVYPPLPIREGGFRRSKIFSKEGYEATWRPLWKGEPRIVRDYHYISISYTLWSASVLVRIDPERNIVYLDDGKEVQFEKCLIATGAVQNSNFNPCKKFIGSIPQLYKELTEVITDGKGDTSTTARVRDQLKHTLFVYHTVFVKHNKIAHKSYFNGTCVREKFCFLSRLLATHQYLYLIWGWPESRWIFFTTELFRRPMVVNY